MQKSLFQALDRMFIRLPMLPVEMLEHSQDPRDIALSSPLLCEALSIASQPLFKSLMQSTKSSLKKEEQLQRSLLRYLIRMSSRTTPFGLFAGIAQTSVGPSTDIRPAAPSRHRHRTRLDMGWLLTYIEVLEQDEKIRPSLLYTYQPIMVRIGNRYHFEYRDPQNNMRNISVVATPGLELLIAKTRTGKAYGELFKEMLAEVPEATSDTLTAFLSEYVTYGVICSSLRPPLTHPNPARYVLQQLTQIAAAKEEAQRLRDILESIDRYDECPPGKGGRSLTNLSASIQQLSSINNGQLPLNIDLAIGFKELPRIQRSVAGDAATLAGLLSKLSHGSPHKRALSEYRNAFVERYGQHRLVPVLEVLNPHSGLGLPSYYIGSHKETTAPSTKSQEYNRTLLNLALQAAREKQQCVQLDDAIIERLVDPGFDESQVPNSLDIAVQIAAASVRDVQSGNYLVVSSPMTGARSAGRSIGRFADMLGDEAIRYLKHVSDTQAAAYPDHIHAELVYMPSGKRAANVSIRPSLQDYELVVGAAPSVDKDHTLSLDDVFAGVDGSRFYLWSAKHQKRVSFNYRHMLNIRSAPNVCRFLIDASSDGETPLLNFSWGTATSLKFLPRITYGRLVLSLAEWKLDIQDLWAANSPTGKRTALDSKKWHRTVQQWRDQWGVPRYVYLGSGDQRLLLDLEQEPHAAEVFYAATANGRNRTLSIQEALPGPEDAWVCGKDGHYINECVFQVVRRVEPLPTSLHTPVSYALGPIRHITVPETERRKFPGSDWLYCKIYIPELQQNEYIATYVKALLDIVIQKHAAISWFFIRYRDSQPHIRLRLNASETTVTQTLLPLVMAWAKSMQRAGLLRGFCIDTYEREIERYGGLAAVAIAEAIFAVDSEMAMRLLALHEGQEPVVYSLPDLTVLTITMMLTALGLDDAPHITQARHAAHRTFAHDYREARHRLLPLLDQYQQRALPQNVQSLLEHFEHRMSPLTLQYRALDADQKLTAPLTNIANSLIHMHVNRMLGIGKLQERRIIAHTYRSLADLPKWRAGSSEAKRM